MKSPHGCLLSLVAHAYVAYPTLCLLALLKCQTLPFAGAAEVNASVCSLKLELIDAETGTAIPGLVQLLDANGNRIELPQLLDRGLGLPEKEAIHHWHALAEPTVLSVPQGVLTLRAFSGLETEYADLTIDLTGRDTAHHSIPLTRFFPARRLGWQAANTHVHLKKTSRAETDRYLIECSKADGLDVVFVSYLERPSEHVHYSTNNYTRNQLRALSNKHTSFEHGEEHRHNLSAWEEGYGHVMLLNIPELIKPVSIGPGITDQGTDGIPLRIGIDKARAFDGRVIWCHNAWGLEDIPSWLAGRLDANNIFDGGTHGSYRNSFYRYLNIGLRVPFSTGTDWFMYDFSRVYVNSDAVLTPEQWLAHLAEGRSYISNGPLLEFSVDGKKLGDDVSLAEPGEVHVVGRVVGRIDFQHLELIQGGRVIETVKSRSVAGHYEAALDVTIAVNQPGWLALRTPPPSAPDIGLVEKTTVNEYGRELFSHTSAIFVDVAGKRVFDRGVAEELLAEMSRNRRLIEGRAKFADDHERAKVLTVYDEAIENLKARLGE